MSCCRFLFNAASTGRVDHSGRKHSYIAAQTDLSSVDAKKNGAQVPASRHGLVVPGTRSHLTNKTTKDAQSFIAAATPDAQHVLSMSDLATRLGTTTTGQLLVRSGIEIERILNAMVQDAAAVTGKFSDVLFLSRLLSFDATQQQVMLAYCDHKPANSAVLAARSVTFLCNHRGAQFAFACIKPAQGTHSGQPAIRMTAPTMMLALQYGRNRTRAHMPGEADVRCDLWMGVISFEARLVDMSLDGKAFLLGDPGIPVCAGTRLQGARIHHGGREPLVVDIEVDQVLQAAPHNGNGKRSTRIGCRIVADREQMDKIARLFIIDLQ